MIKLPPLARLSLRHVVRRPLQSVLLLIGVAVGVAVVVAIDLANASALAAFRLSTEAVTGRATHHISGGSSGLDEALYVTLRTTRESDFAQALRRSAPVVQAIVTVPQVDGRSLTLLGVDPFAEPPFRGFFGSSVEAEGVLDSFLTRPGAVMLGERLADRHGLEVGDSLTIAAGERLEQATIVGLLAPEDALARRALDSLVLSDIATAQELLGREGRLDRIDLLLPESAAERDALVERLSSLLPPDASLAPASERHATVESMTEAFRLNLTALSLLALLVGAFLIFNTVRFSVLQRRSTIATLRSLGVTRREIFATIITEAVILGILGSAVGVMLGIVLGRFAVELVTRTINDLYFIVEVQGVAVQPLSLARGVVAGFGATLLAALVPAWEATAVPPVTALRRSSVEQSARASVPRALVAAMAVALLGGLVLLIPGGSVGLGLLGLGAVVFAFALVAPAVTIALMFLARPVTGGLFGLAGRMAPRDVTRSLSRTGVAIAALMVAVCVSIGVSVMVGSFRLTVEQWLTYTLGADVFISPAEAGAGTDRALPPALAAEFGRMDHVTSVATARSVSVRAVDIGPVSLVALQGDLGGDQRRYLKAIGPPATVWAALERGAVTVSEPFYRRHDVGVGANLRLITDQGEREFEVAGVFYDYGNERGTIFMADQIYRRWWADDSLSSIALHLLPGIDADEFAMDLDRALAMGAVEAAPAAVSVRSNRGLRLEVLEVFDRAFAITDALQILAIVVAFIGILSALMALQLERAREQATLRATGMTRWQLGRLSLLQSSLMGGVAGLLSWPAGMTLALILIYVINRRSFGWTIQTHLQPDIFLRALLLAVAAAFLAALYPTWRLSRMPLTTALREE